MKRGAHTDSSLSPYVILSVVMQVERRQERVVYRK